MTLAEDVRRGLCASQKWLPPYLFYDARGSELFEAITQLPEYYPTRTERAIFAQHAAAIMSVACPGQGVAAILELGAGSASKSQILVSALAKRCPVRFLPVDVEAEILQLCVERFATEEPRVRVTPLVMQNEQALAALANIDAQRVVFFIGSSVGNLSDQEATQLLTTARRSLSPGEALVLGADRKKELGILLPAYDDAAGVTAAFNKNILAHINHALQADFVLERFTHRASWNEPDSSIEIHLISEGSQRVKIKGLNLEITFADQEAIHTESSAKYDDARLDRIFAGAGFQRTADFFDEKRWFGVHVAKAI